jgi:hypothetical protein
MSHTPGPWGFLGIGDFYEIAPVRDGELDWTNEVAATAGTSEGDDPAIEEANASLIAAAPELLEVAKRVAAHFNETNSPLGEAARAAIAKAVQA